MGELSELLEKVRETYATSEPTKVKRLSKKAKCSNCHYSALCLATTFQEVVERLKLFLCPECKNLFATFKESEGIVIKEVPLPGCAAFIFSCQTHVCGEACLNAQQQSRPVFDKSIFDRFDRHEDKIIGIGTPAAPRAPGSPWAPAPNGNNDIWYGTDTGNNVSFTVSDTTDARIKTESKTITAQMGQAYQAGYDAMKTTLDKYCKENE